MNPSPCDCPLHPWRGITLLMVASLAVPGGDVAAELTEIRSYSGSGNNLNHPQWGAAGHPLRRELAPDYPDGMGDQFRQTPNPREISNRLAQQLGELPESRGLSGFAWQWGQFLDHDLSLTQSDAANGSAAIAVSDPGDLLFPTIPLTRSHYLAGTGVSGAPREHPNQNSAYIDASQVYGSDAETMSRLRSFQNGQLLTGGGDLMPHDDLGNFMSGDVRANEQLALMSMHTLFMREHNRLAGQISARASDLPSEPAARDEAIFQRARKLVGAQMQAITYGEFLPALLGEQMFEMKLAGYDPTIDASISNEFAHGLYRFGHSMLPPKLTLVDESGATVEEIPLRDAFFKPAMMSEAPYRLGQILRGLASEPAQQIDTQVVEDVRSFLMLEDVPGGLDLAAINIQRGRDHGLPGYNLVREAFGLPRLTDFAQITTDAQRQQELGALYGDIDQVDLFIGALAEDHLPGTSVGPLLHAALTDQFSRLRDGDRFFYLFDADLAQLQEEADLDLASLTLADIIRANTDIDNLPDNVFFVPEPTTPAGLLVALLLALAAKRRPRA